MTKPSVLFIVTTICVVACGCNNGSSTPVAPSANGYAGEWSGTTTQGRTINVSVSAEQKVTSIVWGYIAGNCSGTKTYSNLSLPIIDPKAPPATPLPAQLPTPQPPFDNPGFSYAVAPDENSIEEVLGAFTSTATLTGEVILSYPACGNTLAIFNATKH